MNVGIVLLSILITIGIFGAPVVANMLCEKILGIDLGEFLLGITLLFVLIAGFISIACIVYGTITGTINWGTL